MPVCSESRLSSGSSRWAATSSNSEFPISAVSIPYLGPAAQCGPLPYWDTCRPPRRLPAMSMPRSGASCPRPTASFIRVRGRRGVGMSQSCEVAWEIRRRESRRVLSVARTLLRRVSEIVPEFAEEGGFPARAHDAGDRLATLEHDQGRDGHHLILLSGQGVGVNVELGHGEAFDVLGGDLFEHWCHGAAGATPLGPEVHQYGCGAFEDVGHR